MLNDFLIKEKQKTSNSFYASEDLIEKLESNNNNQKFGCRILFEDFKIDVPVLKYSKSFNKTSITILIENKNLADVIPITFKEIILICGLVNLERIFIDSNKKIKYKIKHISDDIYKLKFTIKENKNGI